MAVMPTRRPGDGRYSMVEREQRWVLGAVPIGLVDPIEITYRYIRDTDLRLRRMKSADEVIWKLGQKTLVRADSPEVVNLTTIYLREHEYQVLGELQAATLVNTDGIGDGRIGCYRLMSSTAESPAWFWLKSSWRPMTGFLGFLREP